VIDYEKKFEEENKDTITGRSLGEYYQRFNFWLNSQLQAKDKEIESQLTRIYALNARVSHRGKENLNITRLARKSSETIEQLREEIEELKFKNEQTTKERDNHFRDIIKLENELSELKGENEMLIKSLDRCADDYGKAMAKYEALQAKIAKGIPVDIAYTGSTNIITNLPNALYGKFILLGLNEMEDDDG